VQVASPTAVAVTAAAANTAKRAVDRLEQAANQTSYSADRSHPIGI